MMKKKRIWLLGMVMALILTGCGDDGDSSDKKSSKEDKQYEESYPDVNSADNGDNQNGENDIYNGEDVYSSEDVYNNEGNTDYYQSGNDTNAVNQSSNVLWNGFYFERGATYPKPGYVDIRVADDGSLKVEYYHEQKIQTVKMNQIYYNDNPSQEELNNYSLVLIGSAQANVDGVEYGLDLNYGDYGYGGFYTINFRARDAERNNLFYIDSKYKMEFDSHMAPDGYVDQDKFGYISERLKDNTGYFTPMSDNYVVKCTPNYTNEIYDRNTWKSLEKLAMDRYELHDFDSNDVCIKCTVCEVYKTDADAKKWEEYQSTYSSITTTRVGNVIYYEEPYEKISNLYRRLNSFQYQWNFDTKYVYRLDYDGNVLDNEYYYINKPFMTKDYLPNAIPNAENSKLFTLWESGYYKCAEPKKSIWYNGFVEDSINLESFDYCEAIRMYEDAIITVDYKEYYYRDSVTDEAVYFDAVVFEKYEFSPEEIVLSEYVFEVTDGDYEAPGVTFENFTQKDATITNVYHIDMLTKYESNFDY